MKNSYNRNVLRRLPLRILPLMLTLLWTLVSGGLSAQNGANVSGTVKDEKGELMIGVTVIVKNGGGKGTTTSVNGEYELKNLPANTVLVFSFVGYESQEIALGGKTKLDVVMKEEQQALDEVVVIGYGSVRKKDLTGAVAAIGGDKIAARQNTQVMSALQGSVAGVSITRTNSAPGSAGTIRVRGVTSMQESDPLVIVDGVPVASMNDVNPSDIENISILKDAASASIYGARAAAGVVLITTKRGTKKGFSVDYNYSYAMDIPTRMPDYADAVTYMKVYNEMLWNDNPAGGEYDQYNRELINNYMTLNAQDPDRYPNTDWVEMCLRNFAPRQSHQLGITAGNEKYRTKISLGYDDVEGLFKQNLAWKRYSVRVNNDIEIAKWVKVAADINLKLTDAVNPAFSPSAQMRYAAPIYAAVYSDGRLAPGKDGANCYGKMMYGGDTKKQDYLFNGKFSIVLTPVKDLTVTGVFAPVYRFQKQKKFNKQVPFYSGWDDMTGNDFLDGTTTTDLEEQRNDNYALTSQIFANYSKSFGDHNLSVMLGYEDYYYKDETLTAGRNQYSFSYYPYLTAGPDSYATNDGSAYENAYRSYFGRVMYNWKQRYYIQANIRRDGSSRFHKDHRWGNFPSVSGAWVVSQEKFMEDLPVISMLKLRGSWGQLGNERIGNYPYQTSLGFNNTTLYQGNIIQSVQTASASQYAIRNISWETTETTDIGFDLYLLDGRFTLTADYYWKTTKDMLLKIKIPDYMGYSDPNQNAGTMKTKGWDLELGWNDHIGDLTYGVSFNLSDYKSVMGNMRGTYEQSGDYMTREGGEYKEWYGFVSDGIYQTAEEVEGTPVISSVAGAGDIRYVDISGPDGVPDGKITAEYDKVLLGGSLPRYNYGGSINLGYKGFDFTMDFQGVGKRKAMLTSDMVQPIRSDWYNVPEIIVGRYWSRYNTVEQNRQAKYPKVSKTSSSNNYATSDFWMIDGNYFRVKNITLGYTLPKVWLKDLFVQNLRVHVQLQDFFTASHFPKGWDPEGSSTAYPITKSVMFGASVRF